MKIIELNQPRGGALINSRLSAFVPAILAFLISLAGCQSRDTSVVSEPARNSGPVSTATPAATPAGSVTATPTPVVPGSTPAGATASRSDPLASASPSAKRTPTISEGDFTVTKTPAKLTTPTPE